MMPFLTAALTLQAQTLSAMAAASTAMATTMAVALARGPVVSFGNITVYLPFGQGYSQDIDPQTSWVIARAAGIAPDSAEALELAEAFGRQQSLITTLVPEGDGAATLARRLSGAAPEDDEETRAQVDELRALTNRIDRITQRRNR